MDVNQLEAGRARTQSCAELTVLFFVLELMHPEVLLQWFHS